MYQSGVHRGMSAGPVRCRPLHSSHQLVVTIQQRASRGERADMTTSQLWEQGVGGSNPPFPTIVSWDDRAEMVVASTANTPASSAPRSWRRPTRQRDVNRCRPVVGPTRRQDVGSSAACRLSETTSSTSTGVPPPGPLIGTMSIGQAEAIAITSTSARNSTLSPGAETVGSNVMLPSRSQGMFMKRFSGAGTGALLTIDSSTNASVKFVQHDRWLGAAPSCARSGMGRRPRSPCRARPDWSPRSS